MKTKTKIMAFVSLLSLTFVLLMVGVWALKNINFSVGGNLSYVAPGVEATISKGTLTNGVWENAGDASTKMPQTQITKNDTEQTLTTKFSYWQNLNLQFNEAGDDVKISFTITNDSTKKGISINISSSYTLADNCTISVNTVSAQLSPSQSQEFIITMKITDKTQNATMTNFAVVFNMQLVEIPDASDYPYLTLNYNSSTMEATVSKFDNSVTEVDIPSTIKYNDKVYAVTSIRSDAFNDCRLLTNVVLGNGVTTIGSYAFDGCTSLTSIIIPDSVTSIGGAAFRDCTNLKYNTYGNAKYIGNSTNKYVVLMELTSISITSCTINSGCKVIYDKDAFPNCSGLTSINVESGNSVYDSRNNCNAIIETATNTLIAGCKNTIIPNTVTSIGGAAFRDCTSLTSITIPDSVTSIGNSAFNRCESLTSVTIENGVKSIGEFAFYGIGATSIEIPDSVQTIGMCAFAGCESLTTATIGIGVVEIGDEIFYNCDAFTTLYIKATTPPSLGGDAFYNLYNDDEINLSKIYVPSASASAYRSASGWRDYSSYIIGYSF